MGTHSFTHIDTDTDLDIFTHNHTFTHSLTFTHKHVFTHSLTHAPFGVTKSACRLRRWKASKAVMRETVVNTCAPWVAARSMQYRW